jgi:VIT1/CCC1 family predicted Fe2+/Mn2+ transporter
MALSEDEQRRLDEMERALTRDDPRFAASVSIDRVRRRRRIVSACVFLIGIIVLLAGLVTTAESTTAGVVIGVAGALIMIGAVVAVFFPRRRHS